KAAGDPLGVAEIDRRASGAGRPEREPAELQARRGLLRALLDQVEGERPRFLVLALFQHLEPVHHRADRTDEIVAHARAQERREIEGFEGDRPGHDKISNRDRGAERVLRVRRPWYTASIRPTKAIRTLPVTGDHRAHEVGATASLMDDLTAIV